MKNLKFFLLGAILVSLFIPAPAAGWSADPSEKTGYYFTYDEESPPPADIPGIPPLGEMMFVDIVYQDNQLPPYNDQALAFALPDSFWYFGHWYTPEDSFWVSPDGWISFEAASEPGFPFPPETDPVFPNSEIPNALIAPLWQDNNTTSGMGPNNRVYNYFDEGSRTLIVEWYEIIGNATGEVYTYEVLLQLGGQELLLILMDEVVYSQHLIHYLYDTSSDWTADSGATGFEDQAGEQGITYGGTIVNNRKIRSGYFKQPGPGTLDDISSTPFDLRVAGLNTVEFSLPVASEVNLDLFDASGRLVTTLARGTHTAGHHFLELSTNNLPAGVYLVRMEAGEYHATRKLVVIESS